jgi:hypothetical protein
MACKMKIEIQLFYTMVLVIDYYWWGFGGFIESNLSRIPPIRIASAIPSATSKVSNKPASSRGP